MRQIFAEVNEQRLEVDKLITPKVIMLTALNANINFRSHCKSKGVMNFLEKPLTEENLVELR